VFIGERSMEIQHRLELMRLLSAQCDGQLEDAEQTRLEEMLAGDTDARRVYLHYVDMHARLLVHPGMVEASAVPAAQGRPETSAEPVLARLAVTRTKPVEPVEPRSRLRVRAILPYLGVMVATVAATLLIQFAIARWQPSSDRTRQVVEKEPPIPPMYVATLTQSANAEWEGIGVGHQAGSRLLPGEMRLKKGVARIRLDGGADMYIEGPTTLRLESITEASLVTGKVAFRADEAAVPFTLSTPTSLLVESGTACGVEVKDGRDEVHVFEGEIQRFPRDWDDETAPQVVAAGQAWKYTSAVIASGEATTLDRARFVRNLPEAARQPGDLVAGLLAYEPFDYQDAEALKNKTANGGVGWAGPWEPGMSWGGLPGRGGFDRGPKPNVLNVEAGLSRANAPAASSGGMLESSSFVNYQRMLATPVRLDADGVYYLSLLLRRERFNDRYSSLSVTLRQTADPNREQKQQPQVRNDDRGRDWHGGFDWHHGRGGRPEFPKQIMFGLSASKLYTDFFESFRNDRRDSLPLTDGQTYLFVAKIAASAVNSNQIFLRVYGPDDTVDAEEPGDWSLVGKQFQSSFVLDRLELGINGGSNNQEAVDELRLGTTWSSVTAPWIKQPLPETKTDSAPPSGSN
jgi:hypothetical protein